MDSLWILVPGFSAIAAAVLTWFIMQSRMEVKLAREREREAEGHLAEERTRRQALEGFLCELRGGPRYAPRLPAARTRAALPPPERMHFRVKSGFHTVAPAAAQGDLAKPRTAFRALDIGLEFDPTADRSAESEYDAAPIAGEVEPAPVRLLIPVEQPLGTREPYRSPRRFQER